MSENEYGEAAPKPPTFRKVIVATIVAAVTPLLVRLSIQYGVPIETEDATRVAVLIATGAATFVSAWLTSEPLDNVRDYLAAKRTARR